MRSLGALVMVAVSSIPAEAFQAQPSRAPLTKLSRRYDFQTAEPIEYNDFLPNPNPSLTALDVVSACMTTMLEHQDEGLEVCFNFSTDNCRAALGGSLEEFKNYAENPVFGYLIKCADWEIVSIGPEIPGTATRGAMQTILINAKQAHTTKGDDGSRRFVWTLQKERRPPRQNCWVVHEVVYVNNAWALTI